MATSLQTLIQQKNNIFIEDENNLEQGKLWAYSPGNTRTNFCNGFCWWSPGEGIATVEIWGAGGSGGKMCCCGGGLPGNPGAYSKKTFCVAAASTISGIVGMSCGNSDTLCYRGRSQATCICWIGELDDGCMCAQGGRGGTSYCSTGTSLYCCFAGNNFCATGPYNANCGLVCNYGSGTADCCAEAWGGDVNRYGGFSCASFFGCQPSCPCAFQFHVAIPPGHFGTDGAVVTYGVEDNNGFANWSGMGMDQFKVALGVAGKWPSQGVSEHRCWTGGRLCGCHNSNGCSPFLPPGGIPGLPPLPCPNVRDHAYRGGHGLVKIKFVSSTDLAGG